MSEGKFFQYIYDRDKKTDEDLQGGLPLDESRWLRESTAKGVEDKLSALSSYQDTLIKITGVYAQPDMVLTDMKNVRLPMSPEMHAAVIRDLGKKVKI